MERPLESAAGSAVEAGIARAQREVLASRGAPGAWLGLASANWAAGRPLAAVAACDAGLAVSPDGADLLCAKAGILRELDRTDEAASLFQAVLRRQPERLEARFGLALIAVEAGAWDAAGDQLRPLLAAAPDRADLRWLSARVALGLGDHRTARVELERLLGTAELAPGQRADALLLLGEALDALGEPTGAFAAAAEGKRLQRGLHAARAAGREGVVERLRRLEAWFRTADAGPWRQAPAATRVPDQADGHVLLVGFPRSGTTLLEQALAGHPRVVSLEEAPTLADAHAEFLGSTDRLQRLADISVEEAQRWRAHYWAQVKALGVAAPGKVFLDKAPAATEDLPLVAKLFPTAKVLFAIRDPRDVVLSCLRQNFRLNAMTYAFTDLGAAADCYDACLRLAEVYRAVLPLHLLEVRHEDLVADFAQGVQSICRFLDLTFDPAMLDVGATAAKRAVRTPSAPQVRAGLNRRGLGRWRAYAESLAPVLPRLQPWVDRFGYPA